LKAVKNGKESWNFMSVDDIVSDHVFSARTLYLQNMQKRGRDNVTEFEMQHLKAVGEPTHAYKEIIKDGILKK